MIIDFDLKVCTSEDEVLSTDKWHGAEALRIWLEALGGIQYAGHSGYTFDQIQGLKNHQVALTYFENRLQEMPSGKEFLQHLVDPTLYIFDVQPPHPMFGKIQVMNALSEREWADKIAKP